MPRTSQDPIVRFVLVAKAFVWIFDVSNCNGAIDEAIRMFRLTLKEAEALRAMIDLMDQHR